VTREWRRKPLESLKTDSEMAPAGSRGGDGGRVKAQSMTHQTVGAQGKAGQRAMCHDKIAAKHLTGDPMKAEWKKCMEDANAYQ
jgi:hypothetical protein